MSGIVEHALRRLADHALKWVGLDMTDVPSAAVTDDDNEFVGDMRHLNNLLDELVHLCATEDASAKPLGSVHSGVLELWLCDIQGDWPTDVAAQQVERWRVERGMRFDTEEAAA